MKRVNVIYILLFISTLLFGFDYASKSLAADTIYDNKQELNLYLDSELEESIDIIQKFEDFSKEYDIDISQYTYLDDNTLYIYSTNIKSNSSLNLAKGEFPKKEEFLSNQSSNNNKQVGVVFYPLSSDLLRVYNFEEVRNVGLGSQFYLSNGNAEIYLKLKEELSLYGQVEIEDIAINKLILLNVTLLFLIAFSFLVFSIMQFSYYITTRKSVFLLKAWGYAPLRAHLILFKSFYKLKIVLLFISLFFIVFILLLNQHLIYFVYYLKYLTLMWIFLIIIPIPLSFFGMSLIYGLKNDSINFKNTVPFKNYNAASIILKTIFTVIFLALFSITMTKTTEINKAINDDDYWERTENFNRITLKLPESGNLSSERIINDQLNNLYNQLVEDVDAFLMYAENFTDVSYMDEANYLYELNYVNGSPSILPNGRSIIIDENYLIVNPINSVNKKSIQDQLIREKHTLNILVPEKFKGIEDIIEQTYKEEFYFSSIEVDNIYNRAIGRNLNITSIDDLSINIIYVENNQSYFSYNSSIHDYSDDHFLKDPVSIVLDGEYDTSAIASFMTTSVFYQHDKQSEAFQIIEPILDETNTKAFVNEVQSVYQERSNEINQLKKELINLTIGLIMTTILLLVLLFIFIWSYFQENSYKITLQFLFGVSKWRSYFYIIIGICSTNLLAIGTLLILPIQNQIILICGSVMIILELIILMFLLLKLTRDKVLQTIKSD